MSAPGTEEFYLSMFLSSQRAHRSELGTQHYLLLPHLVAKPVLAGADIDDNKISRLL
jgi:hypothetical protein